MSENLEIGAKIQLTTIICVPKTNQSEAIDHLSTVTGVPLSDTIAEIRELHAQRKFCIKTQMRADRSVDSFIARTMGYSPDLGEKETAALWKRVSAVRKEVEKGGGHRSDENHATIAPVEIIMLSASAREPWDKHRAQVEKRMCKLARTLPVWPFVGQIRGFGDLALAIVIGETGDLSNYATKERVWKRCGLAVMDGFRQGDPKRPDTSAESWIQHGYSGKRRSEIWNRQDPLLRAQWRGEKDGVPGHPIGPYGEVYATRKAHTEGRDWSKGRRDNDARRIMIKFLLENLWRVWNGKIAIEPCQISLPREAVVQ